MRRLRHALLLIGVVVCFWFIDWSLDRMEKAWGMDLPGRQDADLPIRFTFLSPLQLQQMIDRSERFTLLDVREVGEFQAGHIVGAINIPYHQLEQRANELDPNQPVVVYCIKAGRRSIIAANTLHDLEFAHVYNVDGGIVGWEKQFPLEINHASN